QVNEAHQDLSLPDPLALFCSRSGDLEHEFTPAVQFFTGIYNARPGLLVVLVSITGTQARARFHVAVVPLDLQQFDAGGHQPDTALATSPLARHTNVHRTPP